MLKRDVGTAKNYLDAREVDTLNRITVMFLDQAEFRAQRRRDIRMRDWEMFLDKFLRDTELPVLSGPGGRSRNRQKKTRRKQRPPESPAKEKPNAMHIYRQPPEEDGNRRKPSPLSTPTGEEGPKESSAFFGELGGVKIFLNKSPSVPLCQRGRRKGTYPRFSAFPAVNIFFPVVSDKSSVIMFVLRCMESRRAGCNPAGNGVNMQSWGLISHSETLG